MKEVVPKEEVFNDTITSPNTDFSKATPKKFLDKVDSASFKRGEKKLKQEEKFNAEVAENKVIEEKAIEDALDEKISGVQVASSSRGKNEIEAYKTKKIVLSPAINDVFVESGMQKLQQLFDIAVLLEDKNTTQEMKDYALSNSSRYYLKPKEKMNDYLLALNKMKADSIALSAMKLKQLIPLKKLNSYKGIYKVKVNYYQEQKLLKQSKKIVTLLLEIVPLNVDGQIYTTIESKVLEVKN
jgi:hypothetical protein